MSINTASVGWNGQVNPAWGLVAKIGPWAQTSSDQKKLNSRSGGPHSGHANFFYSIKPKPFIQSSFIPFEYLNNSVVTKEDFEQPRGIKIPGINKAGSRGAGVTGKSLKIAKDLEIFNENIFNNPEQGGVEKPKEEIISRDVMRPTEVLPDPIKEDPFIESLNDSLNESPKKPFINTNLLNDDHISFNRINNNPRGMPIITNHRGTFRAPFWADSATSGGSSMDLVNDDYVNSRGDVKRKNSDLQTYPIKQRVVSRDAGRIDN